MGARPPITNCCPFKSVCRRLPGGTFTFFSGGRIEIDGDLEGPATPYPSMITVSGLTGEIAKVTVTLFDISHTSTDDLDILLVGPDGTNTILMSDAGGDNRILNVTLTFEDNAERFLPNETQILPGTFKPTNFVGIAPNNQIEGIDNFPAPAPPASASVALSNFNGKNPNGTWSLFVNDDFPGDNGSIQEWAISITTPETEECTFIPL